MKTKKMLVNGFVMTILFIMIIAPGYAQKVNNAGRPGNVSQEQALMPPPPPPPPPSSDTHDTQLPWQIDLPDLSEEQTGKIRQAGLEHMKAMTPMRNQVREKKARLQTILTTMPFDPKAADLMADDLGKIETGIMKEMIRHDQELRGLLTPQQQVLFDARPKPFLRRGK